MQEEEQASAIRSELLERLRSLEGAQSPGSLADLSYRRARESLERAIEEARTIRLNAMEDARATRERELSAMVESLRSLRQSAETQIESVLKAAEIEAERLKDRAQAEAREIVERANSEAATVRAEGAAVRGSAEARLREVERLEAEFNALLRQGADRLGMKSPAEGWWARLTGRK